MAEETASFEWSKEKELEAKVHKLKSLLLLVDPAVSHFEMNSLTSQQWASFVLAFPDEGNLEIKLLKR